MYEHLMDLLRQERSPHVLIIGTRGMGKTTLLQRVRYGVEDEIELDRRYLVLAFPEEQYNVNRLHRFLLNTVDAVADAMERLHDKRAVDRIEEYASSLSKKTAEEVEEQVPQFLASFGSEIHKDFLLLVDNADRLFEMIEGQQQWRLRELLSSRRDLTFFGATTQASDGIYGSDRAFFEFFQIQTLPPLTSEEVRSLLLKLSESVEEQESEKGTAKRRVKEWIDSDAARLRTLVQLTGGNPRTAVLLFHLVLDGLQGGAREYLEQLLDQVTPTYKGRVDELSPQAQQVLDAVALHWDPATAMEVASESGLDTATVSTQLTRLVRQGILEKADPGDSKKALYQVAERFFNIWYLMRASRRVRAKLRWFVEFLRVFFDNGELEQIAWYRIERYRPTWRSDPGEIETAFAYAIASRARRERLEEYLRQHCCDTEEMWRPYLDLMEPAPDEQARPLGQERGDREAEIRSLIQREPGNPSHWVSLGNLLSRDTVRTAEAESAFRRAIAIDPNAAAAWGGLGHLLAGRAGRGEEAESAVRRAIELEPSHARYWCYLGDILAELTDHVSEAEIAYRKALDLAPQAGISWYLLGKLLAKIPERVAEAEIAFRKGAEAEPEWGGNSYGLARLFAQTPGRATEAEAAYREALRLGPEWSGYWAALGDVLATTAERAAEAEAAYRKAIELSPGRCAYWAALGDLFAKTPERAAEAESAYRKAIELSPEWSGYWAGLGDLLAKTPERATEAEAAYRKAIELSPEWSGYWAGLGDLLATTAERAAEAEAAYRKAIELSPDWCGHWAALGDLFAKTPERAAEAESAYRKAIELSPEWPGYWAALGNLFAKTPERAAEAESAYRKAIELDAERTGYWRRLGYLLAKTPGRAAEAEAVCRKAIEVNPEDGWSWTQLGFHLACRAHKPRDAEAAFRNAIRLEPQNAQATHNLGVLLYCEFGDLYQGSHFLARACELDPKNPIRMALAVASKGAPEKSELCEFPREAARGGEFWIGLL